MPGMDDQEGDGPDESEVYRPIVINMRKWAYRLIGVLLILGAGLLYYVSQELLLEFLIIMVGFAMISLVMAEFVE